MLTEAARVMARAPRLEVFRDRAGEFRWRVRASNGRILATSEGYRRKVSALRVATRLGAAFRPIKVYDLAARKGVT